MSTQPDWQQVEHLFFEALELEPEEQVAFLDRVCNKKPALRAEVESLLAASDSATAHIGGAIARTLHAANASQDLKHGERLGPYRLLRRIGEGGLSTVFLADRDDSQYRMQVAIKVVKPGMDTEDILRRLRQERQILASLRHPNIAQLLDGGSTEGGRPYFVMEYIEGEPIDRYCDRHQLSIRQRVELFRTVCSAVHSAHRSLVIHRDIKPSNLLVSHQGVVKLLDFGIAKLLDPAPGEAIEQAQTMTGLRLLTPSYASPEQIRGETLTTATDVYSLGVLLYQLLSGHRPFQASGLNARALENLICEHEPDRASVAAGREATASPLSTKAIAEARGETPERLQKRLAGDLDNIVAMAMRKEAERRYASAEQLAVDLGRHLTSQPVRARQETLAYSAGKFIHRHRGGVLASLLLTLALIGGIVGTRHQATLAAAQRDEAERNRDALQSTLNFLVGVFELADPSRALGEKVTARQLLEQGAQKIEAELEGEPLIRAQLMTYFGRAYLGLGLYEEAQGWQEQALELRRQHHATAVEQAESLAQLGDVQLARGHFEDARQNFTEAMAIRHSLGDQDPQPGARANDLNSLALVADRLDANDEARELYQRALALRIDQLGDQHPDTAESLNDLAELLFRLGEIEDAEAYFRQALTIRENSLPQNHPDAITSLNNLAAILDAKGDFVGAEKYFRQVLEARRGVLGHQHPDIAHSLNNLATVLQAQQHHDKAEPLLREALAMGRRLMGPQHPQVASTLGNLAASLAELGAPAEAEQAYLESLAIKQKAQGSEHLSTLQSNFRLADFYADQGRPEEAIPRLRGMLPTMRRALPAGAYSLTHPLVLLGRLLAERGDCELARPLLEEGSSIVTATSSPDDVKHATIRGALSLCPVNQPAAAASAPSPRMPPTLDEDSRSSADRAETVGR